ncbi:ABC-type sugar transport system, periplasmic component [Synechococcus sp. PCC 7502]|uniref:ABC transporter substrate-binding protein n=1 Tax=Synechococcus sp. PCC 7502 TaxID=1173263 RepID=UPI00029FEA57|nr:ABC transporter substrate-binding protein [Synechococcus sp. PCC 7502]AFY74607.1 ABC-type sugar transport system, periplasmic component [Synechococcus sp. PCC 7502]
MKFLIAVLLCLCIWISGCSFQPSNNKIHLTLWQGVNPPTNRQVLQKLVDKFNQSQNQIFVESLYVGQADQQIPKILAAVVGKAVPDLLWYNPTLTGRLVELDAIRSLDDLLAVSPIKDQLDPAMLSTMQLNGHIWSMPFSANNVAIFYRPSLFTAAGVKNLPQTWDEFEVVAQKLTRDTNGDGVIDQHGIFLPLGKGEFTVFVWLPFLWSADGDMLADQKPQLNSPQAVAALQLWLDLIQSQAALLSQPERGYEEDNFVAGKVAMQISGSWALRYMGQKGIDFGVMPIPRDRNSATAIGGENLFLFKSNPEREQAAWKFAEYVASEEFQTTFATETGYLPINLRAQKNDAYAKYINDQPEIDIFIKQMSSGHTRPLVADYPRISESIGRAIEATLLQKSTPAEALASAQSNLELALKQ